jgi:hypothetical protein
MANDNLRLTLDEANTDEAAAIIVAISTYLNGKESGKETSTWTGNRWKFTGRMSQLVGRTPRIPSETPTDSWTASARIGRIK